MTLGLQNSMTSLPTGRNLHWSCLIQFWAEEDEHLTAFLLLCNCFSHQSKPSLWHFQPFQLPLATKQIPVFLFRLKIKVPPLLSGSSLSLSRFSVLLFQNHFEEKHILTTPAPSESMSTLVFLGNDS